MDENTIDAPIRGASATSQLVKKLVRYVLACEYQRLPIRREGIREKVMEKHSGRMFNAVFNKAQEELAKVFGMQLIELPTREKVTLRDRRAASAKNAQAGGSTTSKTYVLKSLLPAKYKSPEILPASKAPSEFNEGTYVGLYTFIISLIVLSKGTLSDERLQRYLRRVDAETNTPLDKTEALLQRMIKQGYVVKIKDNTGGDEVIEWHVGPRGRVEIGTKGVKGIVREVYGDTAPDDLEDRLRTSLRGLAFGEEEEGPANGSAAASAPASGSGTPRATSPEPTAPRRSRRAMVNVDDD
jgi:hypothetical protein